MFLALVEAGYVPYAVSIVVISGISAVGYFRIMYSLIMSKRSESTASGEAMGIGAGAYVAIGILATALIALGIAFMAGLLTSPLLKFVGVAATRRGVEMYAIAAARVAASLMPK